MLPAQCCRCAWQLPVRKPSRCNRSLPEPPTPPAPCPTTPARAGREYNRRQLDGWYTRMLRDEILAEWQETAPPRGGACGEAAAEAAPRPPRPSLHVFCHVSGEELWPAPPQLRSFIFQREMALVLDTIAHAEGGSGGLLAALPQLAASPVYVHLRSDIPALDRVVEWGVLGDRASWRTAQSTVMASLLSSVMGTVDEVGAAGVCRACLPVYCACCRHRVRASV